MSGRDQDIFHKIVFNVSKIAKTPNILEWGSGQSTIFFTSYLNSIGVDYKWCSLEYNQEFFDTKLYPVLQKETKAKLVWRNPTWDMGDVVTNENGSGLIRLFCFPHGDVKPFSNYADRSVNMDDYVDFPSSLGEKFDLIFVDGRKRRRCLKEAFKMLTGTGIVVLHDSERPYYRCGFTYYPYSRKIGDQLWVGSIRQTDFEEFLQEIN